MKSKAKRSMENLSENAKDMKDKAKSKADDYRKDISDNLDEKIRSTENKHNLRKRAYENIKDNKGSDEVEAETKT